MLRGVIQPGDAGFGWNQLAGEVLAVALVVGAFWRRRRLADRRRAARKERPPQPEKVLRPAGYSASCRIEDLADQRLFAVVEALAAGAVLGILCTAFYPLLEELVLGRFSFPQLSAAPKSYLLWPGLAMALLACLWMVREFGLAGRFDNDLRNWRFGPG